MTKNTGNVNVPWNTERTLRKKYECLFGISSLLINRNLPDEVLMSRFVKLLASSWPYEEKSTVHLVYQQKEFSSVPALNTAAEWITAELKVHGVIQGSLQLAPAPSELSNQIVKLNSHNLLQHCADMLGRHLEQNIETKKLEDYNISLNAILEHSDDYILISDARAKPVLYNKAYAGIIKETLGVDMQPGLQPHTLLDDEEVKSWWDDLHRRVLNGEHFRIEFPFGSTPENTRYFEFSYTPIYQNKKIIGFTEIARDITTRKNIENELRAKETAISHSINGIAFSDFDINLTYVNQAFRKMWHYSPEDDMLSVPAAQFWENPKEAQRIADEVLRSGAYIGELKAKRPDGSLFDTQLSASLVKNKEGIPLFFMGSFIDITEKKRAEENRNRELLINSVISSLAKILLDPEKSLDLVYEQLLEKMKEITSSEHGYVATVDPKTKDLICHTFTAMLEEGCTVSHPHKKVIFTINPDGTYTGLWGHGLNVKKSFLTNDPDKHEKAVGTPQGHIPLQNFLSVPAMIGNEIVGQLAVANSSRKFQESDVIALERLSEIFALAVQRAQIKEKILKSLREKEILLKEIHHRVKNNMAIISSILALQSRHIGDEKMKGVFQESMSRIQSMALVHEKLYESKDFSNINLQDYFTSLLEQIHMSYHDRHKKILTNFHIDDSSLDLNQLISLGLIITEMVTNAHKYAFQDREEGTITISFQSDKNNTIHFVFADDGIGIQENIVVEQAKTLGFRLINTLVQQINGYLDIFVENGTTFRISFPANSRVHQ